MIKTVRRVIALLLAATAVILLVLPADDLSAAYTKGDYVIDGGTLVSYIGTDSDITIPIGIDYIGKEAFAGNNTLTTVYIPDDVTGIDYAAFENCKNLKKVDVGDGVKSIGSSAFSGCNSLSEINIPKNCDELGSGVFAACPSLSDVSIDSKNESFVCLDGVIYSRDGNKLYQYLAGRPYSTYEIPQPVKEISDFAFYGANMLTSVTVAQGVEAIPEFAFLNCAALNNVNLPNSVRAIYKGAFGGCPNLTELTVPTTVGYIDEEAFTSIDGVKGDVVNPATGEVLSESGDTSGAAAGKSGTVYSAKKQDAGSPNKRTGNTGTDNTTNTDSTTNTDNTVSSDVSGIPQSSEAYFTDGNSYAVTPGNELASTVIVGGEAIFLLDPRAMNVKGFDINAAQTEDSISESPNTSAVGEDVKAYSGYEFDVVNGVLGHYSGSSANITIPDDTVKIGSRVFYNNGNLRSAAIPYSVNEIGDFAFARSGLESIDIPSGVSKIGYAAFYNCNNLTNISVPATISTIELGALEGTAFLNNWRNINDGNNFLVLGDGILTAYKGNDSDIVIPSGIKTIGPGVFAGNIQIKSVELPESVTKISEDAFNGCYNISDINLPSGLQTIEDRAFKNTNLSSVVIPQSVSEIGNGAFDTDDVNGGLDYVEFKGGSLPNSSHKPTAERLSAENLRTRTFNGTKYAFVPQNADVNASSLFDVYSNAFRGEVYSDVSAPDDAIKTVQLRKCMLEPDEKGTVAIDTTVSAGDTDYVLSGVSDTAFDSYDNPDWCDNRMNLISLSGNNSDDLDSFLETVNEGKDVWKHTEYDFAKPHLEVEPADVEGVKATLPGIEEDLTLTVRHDGSNIGQFDAAFDNRYGNHNYTAIDTYSVDMYDRDCGIPIRKMATSKLEITMPLPAGLGPDNKIKMASIDENGLLEEVACNISADENGKNITFVASHLSPYAIYIMDEMAEFTVITDSVSITEAILSEEVNAYAPKQEIVYGTLTKEVYGIPARYIVSAILFMACALLLILNKTSGAKR